MIEVLFNKEDKKALAYDNNTKIGECYYKEQGKYWNIVHTEVNTLYRGQGIAKKLVKEVIKNANKHNKVIKAECSYAKKIIQINKNNN